MPQKMFQKLCTKLRPYNQKTKGFRDPISVEKQVGAALYYLADEGRMRQVANSFSIKKSRKLSGIVFTFVFPLYLFNKATELFRKQKIILNLPTY